MKKLLILLLFIGTVLSCSNPLDSVYNEPTFNNDIKLIKDVNEEDSDRIIDQVKYADEIKPGTTYREILEDYHLRKDLYFRIVDFYEQEMLKENFDYNDYIKINIESNKRKNRYSWSDDYFDYSVSGSIKNVSNEKIKIGIVKVYGKKIFFENLMPGKSTRFDRDFDKNIKNPYYSVFIKTADTILYDRNSYIFILDNIKHLLTETLWNELFKKIDNDSIDKKYYKVEDSFKVNRKLTFDDVVLEYKNNQATKLNDAIEEFSYIEKMLQKNREDQIRQEKLRKKRELADAESRRKKRALMKIKNQDREDFITVLKQYSVDNFNTKDALRKYDKEINDFNVLWDDKARMIMKNKTEIGSGQFKSLRVSFQVIVGGKEKTTLFSITVPYK